MDKCPCSMTALELLQANIDIQKPQRSILIVDRGNGWDVTAYGPHSAGFPPSQEQPAHITIQSALECIEDEMVRLRRAPDEDRGGEVITEPAEIVRALSGK